jgi:aspartate beta-hydroxylase
MLFVISILAFNTLTNLNHQNPEEALNTFITILRTNPNSPRARYGKARALDRVAEKKQSNSLLQEAIDAYEHVLALGASVPDKLFVQAAERCINRMRFKGENDKTQLILLTY